MQETQEISPMLDLDDDREAVVTLFEALVVPPDGDRRVRESRSGVLDADGKFVRQSLSWTNSTQVVNTPPLPPDDGEIATLKGRYIFGGILYGHFGHFIVESLARLWAQDAVEGRIDGMVFTPKVRGFPEKAVQKLERLAAPLGLRLPMIVANEPLRVEELIVPRQGFGMADLSRGSRAFRDFINAHAGKDIPASGGDRLYISRSKLPPMRGSLLGEKRLEEYLAAEGYDIFHPQAATPEEQIARYKAARLIVSVDCSPVHLLGYVGAREQRIAIINRRDMQIGDYLAEQLRSFKGMDARNMNALVNDWMPQPGRRPSRTSFGEVDFALLQQQLRENGFVSDPTPWVSLTDEERAEELAYQEERHETNFLPYR